MTRCLSNTRGASDMQLLKFPAMSLDNVPLGSVNQLSCAHAVCNRNGANLSTSLRTRRWFEGQHSVPTYTCLAQYRCETISDHSFNS